MFLLISTVLGFVAPWIPDLFKLFTSIGDRKHELALMEMRLKAGAQEHLWKMEEINARADIEETKATHRPQVSFGVQLLDKAKDAGWHYGWLLPVFYLFALLDFITGFIRPATTAVVIGSYIVYRYACIKLAQGVITGNNFYEALAGTWNENDWAILFMVLAYWFGDRTRQKVKAGK